LITPRRRFRSCRCRDAPPADMRWRHGRSTPSQPLSPRLPRSTCYADAAASPPPPAAAAITPMPRYSRFAAPRLYFRAFDAFSVILICRRIRRRAAKLPDRVILIRYFTPFRFPPVSPAPPIRAARAAVAMRARHARLPVPRCLIPMFAYAAPRCRKRCARAIAAIAAVCHLRAARLPIAAAAAYA